MKRRKTLFCLTCLLYLSTSESFALSTSFAAAQVESGNTRGKEVLARIVSRRMRDLLSWVQGLANRDDGTFVGRCFHGLKRLGMMANVMVFKLGIVITILTFLSVFNLKILGMVGLVVILNVAALAFKAGASKQSSHVFPPPQRIHFHVNPGDFHPHHHDFVDDRSDEYGSDVDPGTALRLQRKSVLRAKLLEYLANRETEKRRSSEKLRQEQLRLRDLYLDSNRRKDVSIPTSGVEDVNVDSSLKREGELDLDVGDKVFQLIRLKQQLYQANKIKQAGDEVDVEVNQNSEEEQKRILAEQLELKDLYRRLGYPNGLPI